MKIITTIALSIALIGCAAPPPLNTASGRPEVFLQGVSKKQVMDLVVAAGLSKGLQVRSATEYGVVFAKKNTDMATAILYGSRYNSSPELRAHFNIVDVAGGVQVYIRTEIVTNPGSGFERINDVTKFEGQSLQTVLMELKSLTSK